MSELNDLKTRRDALVLKKRELETKLAAVKNLVRSSGRMPHDKYKVCCESQNDCFRQIVRVETDLMPIKQRIRVLCDEEDEAKKAKHNGYTRDLVLRLREVRDKWQEIASDDALANSTQRTQASQFVSDLNPIIHYLLDPPRA